MFFVIGPIFSPEAEVNDRTGNSLHERRDRKDYVGDVQWLEEQRPFRSEHNVILERI